MKKLLWAMGSLGAILLAASGSQIARAGETVTYYHTDALGSVVATSDASGNIIERREYEPYGRQMMPSISDGPGYTGHVSDAATGLSYMQQRYYDPNIGRFLSVDPVVANSSTGANFNRYRYANNNPYKFKDPDGRESACFSTGKGTSCGASQPTAEDRAKFEQAAKTTAEIVVPGAGIAACASGGCAAGGWAAAAVDAIPGGGKIAGALGKMGNAALKVLGKADKVGDLTRAEVKQIQGVVNQAGRPLEVVGSAASGTRRGVGTALPIGKGPGTRSDIDYLAPPSSAQHFDGLQGGLPVLIPERVSCPALEIPT